MLPSAKIMVSAETTKFWNAFFLFCWYFAEMLQNHGDNIRNIGTGTVSYNNNALQKDLDQW